MTPELVFEFPARYELVFHDRIPREAALQIFELPSGRGVDSQQELALAPIVEVRPATATPWVGILFAEAAGNVRGTLIGWPDEESFCFFGGGGAYVVSSSDPRRLLLIDGGQLQQHYVVAEAEVVLFADWQNLHAYGRNGLLWTSAQLALDDLTIEAVDGDVIACSGFFGATAERFTVDLRTGTTEDSPMTFDD